jgi:hypothetical protein
MSRESNLYAPRRTFNVDLAVSSGGIGENLRVKLGASSDVSNDVVLCGANELGIGFTEGDCFPPVNGDTTGSRQIVVVLDGPTKMVKTAADITRGAVVGAGATGYVVSKTIDTSAPGTVIPGCGIALEASTAGTNTSVQEIEIMQLGGYIPV